MNKRLLNKVNDLESKHSQKNYHQLLHVIHEHFGEYCDDISITRITDAEGIAYSEKQYYEKYPERIGHPEYYSYREKQYLSIEEIKKDYPLFDIENTPTMELRFV